MKVGVGVITMGVRELNPKLFANTTHDIFVYTDTEHLGPAHARNKVLAHFENYDHVFIFDDDVYPTRPGWEDFFIRQAQQSGIGYMALPEVFAGQITGSGIPGDEIVYWRSALGCFVYQSKEAIHTIGGYNTEYNRYGYEDAGRSHRAIKAGLTGALDAWGFPIRGLSYIHSEDVFGENPQPNISTPDKLALIEQNKPIYQKEVESFELYYPYK